MLVLTRKVGDSVLIGDTIKIQVVKVKGGQVRLGIEAPKEAKIFRHEVLENIKKSQSISSQETSSKASVEKEASSHQRSMV